MIFKNSTSFSHIFENQNLRFINLFIDIQIIQTNKWKIVYIVDCESLTLYSAFRFNHNADIADRNFPIWTGGCISVKLRTGCLPFDIHFLERGRYFLVHFYKASRHLKKQIRSSSLILECDQYLLILIVPANFAEMLLMFNYMPRYGFAPYIGPYFIVLNFDINISILRVYVSSYFSKIYTCQIHWHRVNRLAISCE